MGQSNKNYIMTHGVSGVDWSFYKLRCLSTCMKCICSFGKTLGSTFKLVVKRFALLFHRNLEASAFYSFRIIRKR
jgi:hypothetical protein